MNNMNAKKFLGALVFFIIVFIMMKIIGFGNRNDTLCCEFEKTTLSGIVDKTRMARKNVVSLSNQHKDFYFMNTGNYNENNYKKYYELAEIGDSINKLENADTLWLFKDNQPPIFFEIIKCCKN